MTERFRTPAAEIKAFDINRHATDIPLLHLSVRAWQEQEGYNYFTDIESSQEDLSDISKHYLAAGSFFVAETPAGEVVGIVGLRRADNHAILKRLAVRPDYQGRGIGSQLVESCVNWAKKSGLETMGLSTGSNEQARGIYDRCGFKVIGRNERNCDFIMWLDLRDDGDHHER